MKKETEIIIKDASIRYQSHSTRLLDFLAKNKEQGFLALSNINLQIRQGERVGLIGLNGAGKSTLLKMMAKIYHPSSGICHVEGRVCPLFEFATGFEMDMNGWSNIRIRAKLLGMSSQEIKEKIQEIADFTELGKFLDYPVRTYSAGMFIRLAFAISTAIIPEILLLDEVIGAGDISFTQKAAKRMETFMQKGQILVLATHTPDLLKNFCARTLWLHQGRIMMDGPTSEVWQAYTEFSHALRQEATVS
ncbi:ABC transporter ATP-binding protein [Legionella fairfieldensis]|uniref:ABC transporter ATP-binding protein n=1 Tax=Legionella fairfieldensis TaxID=45064 RepID=UPI00056628C2|nr:ABC transporter ATP-binding protein [Legionella fairfieldensis]